MKFFVIKALVFQGNTSKAANFITFPQISPQSNNKPEELPFYRVSDWITIKFHILPYPTSPNWLRWTSYDANETFPFFFHTHRPGTWQISISSVKLIMIHGDKHSAANQSLPLPSCIFGKVPKVVSSPTTPNLWAFLFAKFVLRNCKSFILRRQTGRRKLGPKTSAGSKVSERWREICVIDFDINRALLSLSPRRQSWTRKSNLWFHIIYITRNGNYTIFWTNQQPRTETLAQEF